MITKITIVEKSFKEGKWSLKGTDGKYYSFWETKKSDGKETKAFEQFKKFQLGVGTVVDAEVAENPYTDKKGNARIGLNIIYFKTDEHGTPHMQNVPNQAPVAQPVTRFEFNQLSQEVQDLREQVMAIGITKSAKGDYNVPVEKVNEDLPPWLQKDGENNS